MLADCFNLGNCCSGGGYIGAIGEHYIHSIFLAKQMAISLPSPRLPPVTNAILPLSNGDEKKRIFQEMCPKK